MSSDDGGHVTLHVHHSTWHQVTFYIGIIHSVIKSKMLQSRNTVWNCATSLYVVRSVFVLDKKNNKIATNNQTITACDNTHDQSLIFSCIQPRYACTLVCTPGFPAWTKLWNFYKRRPSPADLSAAKAPADDADQFVRAVNVTGEGTSTIPLAGVHPAVRVAGTQHLGDDGLAAVHVLLLARLLLHQGKFGGPQTFSVDGRECWDM